MRIPSVKSHTRRFELSRSFGKPKRLQGKRHCEGSVLGQTFVIIVDIRKLQTVNPEGKFASAFNTHQMRKFMRDHIRDPRVSAANFKVPVRKEQVHRIFVRNGRSVCVKCILQRNVDFERHIDFISGNDRIVNRFSGGGNDTGMGRVFCRIGVIKVGR